MQKIPNTYTVVLSYNNTRTYELK